MTRRMMLTLGPVSGLLCAAQRRAKVELAEVRSAGGERFQSYEFVLESEMPFPARALDPVLHVGAVEVETYRHEGANCLVFSSDPGRLPMGAQMYMQYGNDVESRQDLGFYRGLVARRPKK